MHAITYASKTQSQTTILKLLKEKLSEKQRMLQTFTTRRMLIQVGVSVRWRHNRHTKTDQKVQEALDKARVLPLRLHNCFRVRVQRVEEAIGGINEFEQKGEPAAAKAEE
jgi:hypothetical protein